MPQVPNSTQKSSETNSGWPFSRRQLLMQFLTVNRVTVCRSCEGSQRSTGAPSNPNYMAIVGPTLSSDITAVRKLSISRSGGVPGQSPSSAGEGRHRPLESSCISRSCGSSRWFYTPAVRSSRRRPRDGRQLSARPQASPLLSQAAQIGDRYAGLVLFQNPDDLLFRKTTALHALVLVVGQSELQPGLSQRGNVSADLGIGGVVLSGDRREIGKPPTDRVPDCSHRHRIIPKR